MIQNKRRSKSSFPRIRAPQACGNTCKIFDWMCTLRVAPLLARTQLSRWTRNITFSCHTAGSFWISLSLGSSDLTLEHRTLDEVRGPIRMVAHKFCTSSHTVEHPVKRWPIAKRRPTLALLIRCSCYITVHEANSDPVIKVFNREYVWRLTTRDTPDGVLDDPYNLDGSDLRPSRQITGSENVSIHISTKNVARNRGIDHARNSAQSISPFRYLWTRTSSKQCCYLFWLELSLVSSSVLS